MIAVFVEHKVRSGFGLGGLGVWLFFTLSGFLIIGILHRQRASIEHHASNIHSEMISFWKRRVLRIFPLYYAVLLCIAGYLLYAGRNIFAEGLHWYAAYMSNFFIVYVTQAWSKFSHLWSLAVEQQFYLIAAPVFLLVPMVRHRSILIITLLGAGTVLLAAARFFDSAFSLYLSPLPNFGFMAIGGILALEASRWKWSCAAWKALFVSGILMIPAIVAIERLGDHGDPALAAVKFMLGYWLSFAVIGYVSTQQDSRLTGILSLKLLSYIGTISYGFYIFHLFAPSYEFVARVLHLSPDHAFAERFWFVAQFLMTVCIASASWFLFEKPILGMKAPGRLPPRAMSKDVSGNAVS